MADWNHIKDGVMRLVDAGFSIPQIEKLLFCKWLYEMGRIE
jgi:hypothetical protein